MCYISIRINLTTSRFQTAQTKLEQQEAALMIEKWNITIPELTGDTQRGVYVYLPESLKYDSGRRCPVLYMFDGLNVFFDSDATYGKFWGLKEYMDYTQTQVIIAAVESSHSPDHGRLKEYSPYTFSDPDCGAICGCGRITMEWMTKAFQPLFDSRYFSLSVRKNTYLAGSSLGGLMSLYAVLEYNHVYSRAAALSPSLWTSPSQVDRLIRQAHIADDTVIYMDYGSQEFKSGRNMERIFNRTVEQLLNRRIYLTSRIVPEGRHCEASWEKQLPFMMHTLTYQI